MARLGQRGQSTVETMIMITFLTFAIWSFIYLGLLMATKQYVNYAAFAAARAGMVSESEDSVSLRERGAVKLALDHVQWTPGNLQSLTLMRRADWPVPGKTRSGVEVPYKIPIGVGFTLKGFAPIVVQKEIEEEGDNAN